jgi:hypothetical protein
MTALAAVLVLGVPVVMLVGLLKLVDALQRRRAAVIARQIEVTDAIHREFGAIVAPIVRRARGGWRVTLPMDPARPGAARVVDLAARTLGTTATVGLRSRRPFDGRGEPVVEVAVVAPWGGPRRAVAQNRERIASATSA